MKPTCRVLAVLILSGNISQVSAALDPPYPGGLRQCVLDVDSCSTDLVVCEAEVSNFANYAPVPQTGQKFCADVDGRSISCAGTGQDGELQTGVVWPTIRFIDNADGTIADNLTRLVWLKNADCFGLRTWAQALTDASNLQSGQCGLSDGSVSGSWRLPNVRELHSLVSYGNANPALPQFNWFTGFSAESYWTSTSLTFNNFLAYTVDFFVGFVDRDAKEAGEFTGGEPHRVIFVRTGP